VLPIEVRVFVTVALQASPQMEENQAGDRWYRYTEWNENHLELSALFFFFKPTSALRTSTQLSTLIWIKKVNGVFSAKGVFSYTTTVANIELELLPFERKHSLNLQPLLLHSPLKLYVICKENAQTWSSVGFFKSG